MCVQLFNMFFLNKIDIRRRTLRILSRNQIQPNLLQPFDKIVVYTKSAECMCAFLVSNAYEASHYTSLRNGLSVCVSKTGAKVYSEAAR